MSLTESLLDKIDPRTITSAGGILLSFFMAYLVYVIVVDNVSKNQQQMVEVITSLDRNVQSLNQNIERNSELIQTFITTVQRK